MVKSLYSEKGEWNWAKGTGERSESICTLPRPAWAGRGGHAGGSHGSYIRSGVDPPPEQQKLLFQG